MRTTISRYRRRTLIEAIKGHLREAADGLSDLLLSEDTLYATQEAQWQEGPEGARSCAATDTLRRALTTLRALELPEAGDLG